MLGIRCCKSGDVTEHRWNSPSTGGGGQNFGVTPQTLCGGGGKPDYPPAGPAVGVEFHFFLPHGGGGKTAENQNSTPTVGEEKICAGIPPPPVGEE